jgi:4-diphosphocytidyl-2-C-methyl-D-erythritol kinase
LLVNPRVPLATGPVFAAWDGQDRGPLPDGPASRIASEGRNDLETAAISLCPPIAEVLAALTGTGADLVRMSGSGATCFATYRRHDVMLEAAEKLASDRPDWWQMQGKLR